MASWGLGNMAGNAEAPTIIKKIKKGGHGNAANPELCMGLAVAFIAISMFFVWRSFYGMRIKTEAGH